MEQLPPIKCLNFKVLDKGSLRGFFDVEVATSFGPLVIRDCRLIQQDGRKAFISTPQKEYTGNDGTKKWSTLVELPKEWKDEILKKALPLVPVRVAAMVHSGRTSEGSANGAPSGSKPGGASHVFDDSSEIPF